MRRGVALLSALAFGMVLVAALPVLSGWPERPASDVPGSDRAGSPSGHADHAVGGHAGGDEAAGGEAGGGDARGDADEGRNAPGHADGDHGGAGRSAEPGQDDLPDHGDAQHLGFPEEVDGEPATVLTGDYPDGYVVEADEIARIDGLVTMAGNLVVHGVLRLRPGAHLTFRDTDMDAYVGADDRIHQDVVASDVGLWVTTTGVLDAQGTPKQGWNRTGEHPTWDPDDEYWISPTEPGDHEPRRWSPGDPIPRHDPRVPAAEVINVTRDVVVQGPAHIHIHSHRPQRIEYVQLRDMGVSNEVHEGPVLGRYALHLHDGGDGTRGTIIRGVASIDARGRVFVPHRSHGITISDVVSVNSYAEVLWWDEGDSTHDLLVEGLAATGVQMPESVAGTDRNIPVVLLGSNDGAAIHGSAVSGARGRRGAIGYHWNTKSAHGEKTRAVWDFHDNVTHNNEGHGLRFWFNDKWNHHVRDTTIYNNGHFGIENGAYTNVIRYTNVLVLDNEAGGVLHHSSSNFHEVDGGPSRYRGLTVDGPDPAIEIGRLRGTPETRQEFIDCDLGGGRVVLDRDNKTREPFVARFVRCGDLTPDDLLFPMGRPTSAMDGTSIVIEHPDGRAWEVTVEGREVIVSDRG